MALDLKQDNIFENVFQYAAIGMALVSPDGRWLRANRALCGITGYSEAELLQTTFQEITHPDDLSTSRRCGSTTTSTTRATSTA